MTVPVTVTVPATATPGISDTLTLQATNVDDPAISDSDWVHSTVSKTLWIDVEVYTNTLALTDEGWPTPNPLVITVTVWNNTDEVVEDVAINFIITSTNMTPRFYVLKENGHGEGRYQPPMYQEIYLDPNVFPLFTIEPGKGIRTIWRVWVQPSEATTLSISADFQSGITRLDQDTEQVSVPQAQIHPVVFLHGILGSQPPDYSVITRWPQDLWTTLPLPLLESESYLDPFVGSYTPLIENLIKMGYELHETLFPVTYDWRQSNQKSASFLGAVLHEYVPNHVNDVPYAVHDSQADVIVHSMGGLVLRAYLEDLADDPQYRGLDHVNKAVFIATPHRGFPITYRTWEGLTWEEYTSTEIDPVSDGLPIGVINWITTTYSINLPAPSKPWVPMGWTMDHLLWPYLILKKYQPQPYEPCWLPDPDVPLVPGRIEHNLSLLGGSTACHWLAPQALYDFSHHPERGIRSLPEMLPEAGVSPPYLQGWASLPPPPGLKDYPWCGTLAAVPSLCSPNGRQDNPLLETAGLNDPANVSKFVSRVGAGNIYVLYNSEQPTPYTYEVLPPSRTPEYEFEVPFTENPTVTWRIPSVDWWYNGRPYHTINGLGDNLIPHYSTRLHYGGLVTLPDETNQELLIHDTGHKRIVLEQESQSAIGAILTGYVNPKDARDKPALFALYTSYTPPRFGPDNLDALLVFLVWSPADVLVSDPLGRRVGYDPAADQIVNEIPGAFYTGNGSDEEFILIPGDLEGEYTVTVTGVGTGLYAVSAHRVDSAGVQDLGIVSGAIAPGQVVVGTVTWAPETEAIFEDDMESGGGNWAAEGGWSLATGDAHSPVTAWAGQPIKPGVPLTLTLQVPLDLSTARWARLTFWYSQTLSAEAAGVVELSLDGGEHWTAVAAHTEDTGEWRRRTLDLTPFTEPGLPPLRLRFRLFPATLDDRWLIDDVRAEALPTPALFELPFQDDVEGWRKWDATGGWARTDTVAHSPRLAWQADTPGATLTLAGALNLREIVSPTLTFWYTMQAGGEGMVEVSTDDGATWQPAATITETTGWAQADVDLSAWAGLTAGLRLRHTGQAGADWAVDDFDGREVVPPVVHPLPFGDDMEAPTANWRAVNAWQPITGTAHSGTSAWQGYAGDSALILVDRLDLSETVSPTLTFWQQFALPQGSTGQVVVSANGGLTWEPVLTITEPILDWTQVEVDLNAYAGQEIGLAFYLSEVTTGTQGSEAGVPDTPRVAAGHADRPAGEGYAANTRLELPILSLSVLAILAAPTLAVVWVRSRGHRTPRWAWVVLALTMGAGLGCGIGYNVPVNPYPSENRVDDILGEVEPVVLAERGPGLSSKVSPNGRWLIVNLENVQGNMDQLIAIDLEHNREYQIAEGLWARGLVWLDDNHAVIDVASGPVVFRASDRTVWSLENQMPRPDSLGGLAGADFIYAIEELRGGGSCLVTTDPDFPYLVAVNWEGAELEEHLSGVPHTIIQTGLIFDPDARYYSPDGRYYIAERSFRDPGSFMGDRQEAMFDAATEKEVAHAYKHYWSMYFLGWAYDSSGAYFMFMARGDGDILHPRHPIYKLLVPGATPRGTPMPMYTPTPTREGGGQMGYTSRPGNKYASRPTEGERTGVRGGVGALALVLPMLGVPVLAVVRRQRERRSACRWIWLAVTFLALACSPCNCCSLYPAPASPYASENRLQDVLGEVEPVVLAEQSPLRARLSPDGRWLLVSSQIEGKDGPVFAIDVEQNQEYLVMSQGRPMYWINETHALFIQGIMLRVPDLEMWNLEERKPDSDSLDKLEGAPHIYALDYGGHAELVTTDPDFPYRVVVNWNSDEIEAHLAGIPHTIIQTTPPFAPDARYYSPDGRYYIAERPFRDPGSFMTYGQGAMFDAATEKEAAHAYKHYWNTYFLGWAYDSSGAYFMFLPRTADADVLHPRHPIYKLLVPGAKPGGTPVPMYTPTPTRDGSVPPGATVIPLNTPIPPDSSRAPGAGLLADGGRTVANSVVGALALVLPMLGVPVLAVVRRQREKRSACRWIWLAVTFLALACSPCNCCSLYPAPASPYASENRLQDVLGEVEPVVLAEREPTLASVSPDGKWMLVLLKDSGPVLAIDLENSQELSSF